MRKKIINILIVIAIIAILFCGWQFAKWYDKNGSTMLIPVDDSPVQIVEQQSVGGVVEMPLEEDEYIEEYVNVEEDTQTESSDEDEDEDNKSEESEPNVVNSEDTEKNNSQNIASDNTAANNIDKTSAKKTEQSVVEKSDQNVEKNAEKPKTKAPSGRGVRRVVRKRPAVRYICRWLDDFITVDAWKREGGVLFTPKTKFYLRSDEYAGGKSVLMIESSKSSAVFGRDMTGKVDLNKTPIMRWRWRVRKLPPRGDGRNMDLDDQAVGIYIGTGSVFNKKSIAYRWETDTPKKYWGLSEYTGGGKVWFHCQRNKDDGLGIWYEEMRDVRQDFIDKYGFVPKDFALVIGGNSQKSKSDALAEIDYIGFYQVDK